MTSRAERVDTGIQGLDDLLCGGFVSGRMYLVCGLPGTGTTIFGMHFLEEGLERDETALFIHGEESREEICLNGYEIGIDIADAEFLDLGPGSEFFTEDRSYDLVEPRDVERDRYTSAIHDAIRTIDPDRVVIDPITQLRYIEANDHQFRKRMLSFMRFLKERDVTVVATATSGVDRECDLEIRSLSDGVVELTRTNGERRIQVTKHRGFGQMDGSHGLVIRRGGMAVFPALIPDRHDRSYEPTRLGSGIADLDALLGGGIEPGTVTFVSGPTGVGKTTMATQLLTQAAAAGTGSAIYLFEEGIETFTCRLESIGTPVSELRESGALSVAEIEPLARSAEEFAHLVRQQVDEHDVEVVLIDGIDGYKMSMQGQEDTLIRKLHALTRYLKNRGVTVIVTDETTELIGLTSATSSSLSYVADNIVFLTYVETRGNLRKAIGVLKKRAGGFEHTLREFEITADGIQVGEPLTEFTGIVQGTTRVAPGPVREQ